MTIGMPDEFAVTVRRTGADAVVTISGDLDMDSAQRLWQHLDDLVRAGDRIAIDAGGVTFIDSAGLQVLLVAGQSVRERGGDLRVTVASERLAWMAKIAGVSDRLLPDADGG